jgi:polysaccharide export outer membrane protein
VVKQARITRRMPAALLLMVLAALALTEGCAPNWIGRYNELAFCTPKRVRNPIWDSFDEWYEDLRYWVQEELEQEVDFPGPLPSDLKPPEGNYILGPFDLLEITINDLFQPGVRHLERVRIAEDGNIQLPYVGRVQAAGLSAAGLEQRLMAMYSPDPLADPKISVFISEYRNRFCYFMGAVNQPGMYPLLTPDMELLQVVAQAGGVSPMAEQFAYLSRRFTAEELNRLLLESYAEDGEGADKDKEKGQGKKNTGSEVAPGEAESESPKASSEGAAASNGSHKLTPMEELQLLTQGRTPPVKEEAAAGEAEPAAPAEALVPEAPAAPSSGNGGEWKFVDGRWVQTGAAAAPAEGDAGATAAGFTLPEDGKVDLATLPESLQKKLARLGIVQGGEGLRRIIRIDIRAALQLDPTQNPVMRNGDVVNFPEPAAGEWYINGEVARRGVYSLTGRKITLLQAIAAAGGLTEVAIPKRGEVVRRVGENEEEIIYFDLAKIAKGESPDFFLQPDDYINIGTDQGAIWMAVLRNAFRATYGFGLVYDQNFADIYPFRGDIQPLFGRN